MEDKKNRAGIDREVIIVKNSDRGVALMETLDERMSFPHMSLPDGIGHIYRNMNSEPRHDVWHIKGSTVGIEYDVVRGMGGSYLRAISLEILGNDSARNKSRKYLEHEAGGKLDG
jgi:hypothetical protein